MDTLPVECLCMIAGYLPEADRASLRAASAWLAWSLPVGVCFDVEARLRKSKDPAFWEWALQHIAVDALQRPDKLFHKAVKLGVVIAVQALSGRVAHADARKALRDSAWGGHLEVLKHLHQAFGLSTEDARADHNCALRYSAYRGHLDIVMYLREAFGLTSEHARADDNEALRSYLRHAAIGGHLPVVKYLREGFGLTAEDARVEMNEALRSSAVFGHLAVGKYLRKGFGLTADDARVAYEFGNVHPAVDEYMREWVGVQPSCPESAHKPE
jgi:hypothetical protein